MPKVETFNKELVLKQAIEVFHDKGYNATSMQDLVDATGLNRSSIYNSFDSKLNLFILCLKAYNEEFMSQLLNDMNNANNALHTIETLLNLYMDLIFKDEKDKGCLITNCTSEMANQEPSITKFLKSNQESFLAFLEEIIIKGQQDSLINKKQTPKAYALYLFSSFQGFRTTGILIPNKNDMKQISKTIIQTLI